MYDTDGVLPVDRVPAGTRLLGVSPPMLGLRRVAYRLLARGLDDGQGAVAVTVDRSGDAVGAAVRELVEDPAALRRLAIVDATGQTTDSNADGPYRIERVGSPADLTGIGISVSRAVDTLEDAGVGGVRLVVDSLSSLAVYVDFEQVYQFVHVLGNQVGAADGVGLFLLNGDTDRSEAPRVESLVEGTLELREDGGEGGPEWRLRGLDGAGEWAPFDRDGNSGGLPTGGSRPEAGDEVASGETTELDLSSVSSVHDLIERVGGSRYTLTVYNPVGTDAEMEELRSYLDGLSVEVRTAELSTPEPTGMAVLHRDEEPLAMNPVDELLDAIRFDEDVGTGLATVRPDVLDRVHRRQYTVENGGKLRMVRISRLVETRALDVGSGTLHAGFQRLSRITDELGTRQLYERIAATDVDVHVYGKPGAIPNAEQYTVHAGETPELADSWFVVYDGGGHEDATGALVSEETGPEEYSGFWTYKPPIVAAAEDYLTSTYGSATA